MNVSEKKRAILYWLPSVIFNILETAIILSVGYILDMSIYRTLYIIAVFEITRYIVKQSKHYKNPYKCLFWSTTILTLIFIVSKIDIIAGTMSSILGAYMLSGKADIQRNKEYNKKAGMYLWKKSEDDSKYKFIEKYIEENKDSGQIKNFEIALNNINSEYYRIYKLRFHDNKSLKYIANEINISSTARVTERLDNIQNILLGYVQGNKKELIKK